MSRAIRRVSVLVVVLLLALVANLVYVQVVHAGSHVDKPGNSLARLRAYAAPRGPIVVDGADIAESKAAGGPAAQAGVPRIAVAVILENAGVSGNEVTGGLAAGPVAKPVMTAYLGSISHP